MSSVALTQSPSVCCINPPQWLHTLPSEAMRFQWTNSVVWLVWQAGEAVLLVTNRPVLSVTWISLPHGMRQMPRSSNRDWSGGWAPTKQCTSILRLLADCESITHRCLGSRCDTRACRNGELPGILLATAQSEITTRMEILEESDIELLLQQTLWMQEDWLLPLPAVETSGELPVDAGSDGAQPSDATSCAFSVASGSDAVQPSTPPLSQRRRSSINPSRERRKRELIALRAEEKELVEQLEMLQYLQETRLEQHPTIDNGRVGSPVSMWGAIARRQFEACVKAETINTQLKAKVADHTHLIRDILRLLQQVEQDPETKLLLAEVPPVIRVPGHLTQSMSEAEHEQRVDTLMAQWETLFCSNEKFMAPCVDFCETRIVSTLDTAIVLEARAGVTLPFRVERVGEALWMLYQRKVNEGNDVIVIQEHRSTDDTIIGGYTSMVLLQDVRGMMNGKFVTKRYAPVPSQRLLVTHTYSESKGFSNDFDGIDVSESTWVRLVHALELEQSSLQTPGTVIQYVVRTRICLDARHQTASSAIEEKTTAFLAHMQRELEWGQGILEKQLMQPDADQSVEV